MQRMPRRCLLILALSALVAVSACGGTDADAPPTVYAAASLRDVFPAIDKAPRYSFAGSNQLQMQIERGAPADVFASAGAKEPEALHAAGRCTQPVAFASNAVVLLVPAGNPGKVTSLESLASGPPRRLAVGTEDVPVGKYTRELLETAGLSDILSRNTVSNEANVASLTSKVALGSADAGFAYNTDARAAGDRVEVIRLPTEAQPKIQYLLCAVRRDGANTEAAQAFIDSIVSEDGRRALQQQGFGPPPGT
jgi:molybdate transport system substrate-binding protein